ncbi:MAG: GatB/YqeY domain-containing protein [Candidatus Omnitrophica bacterium]|jgi:uncharacterized protein YqeY|nr:GatB/YqeY domain-containing protein [Candidatus Omnitrophota bacterium]
MLEERIYQDYLTALKSKDRQKTDFLSLVRSELKNQCINLKKEKLEDSEVLSILKKQQKRLLEAKESILTSKRADLIENLEKELSIIEGYLPQPLSNSELSGIIQDVINKTGASSIKEMGKVMKEVLNIAGARADSKIISSLVKEKLTS